MQSDPFVQKAHDIRTPLTSVKGCVDTVLRGKEMPPETQREFLEMASKEIDRLSERIEDFIAYAKTLQS